jgi:predicted Holliday junction resolvase-like endonuclease
MIEIMLAVILVLLIMLALIIRWNLRLRMKVTEALSSKQSLSTKYGRMTEQFMPFLKSYPYDEQNFRFLGTPVDGVQFNDDGIVFVEFKSASSRMSPKQRNVKELVDDKKVKFEEIRIE